MDEMNSATIPSDQPAPPAAARQPRRKPYTPPAIVSETRLETRAGSPLSVPLDPMNTPNDYGL